MSGDTHASNNLEITRESTEDAHIEEDAFDEYIEELGDVEAEEKAEEKCRCQSPQDRAYQKALEYVEARTKTVITRYNMLTLLERIRKGEMITMDYLKHYYPTCYKHFLELRRNGIIILVTYRPGTQPVLRFSDAL